MFVVIAIKGKRKPEHSGKPTLLSYVLFLVLGLAPLLVQSQGFALLRQNDRSNTWDTIVHRNPYEKLKRIQLSDKTTLSFGGSWRFQTESFINEQFQKAGKQDNIWYLNRFLGHAHLKVGPSFELFAELGSSLVQGKEDVSPVDKDALYVNQLFVRYRFDPHWDMALGRHNMRLGSGRLVDIREGPNVRRQFDMVELNYQDDRFKAKTFFSMPVHPNPHVFDNDQLDGQEYFTGIYTTGNLSDISALDAYVLYQRQDGARYNNGFGNERRTSVGLRYFGRRGNLSYNNEMVYQFGSLDDQTISAWTLSAQLENSFQMGKRNYTLGIRSELISGDRRPDDGKLNTFDALYPRGAYFGRVARFGPSNLIDVHPYLNGQYGPFFIEVDYDAFWRYSKRDGIYNPALILDYPDTNDARFIAHQFGAIIGFQVNGFLNLEMEGNMILPGPFLERADRSDVLGHLVFTAELKF